MLFLQRKMGSIYRVTAGFFAGLVCLSLLLVSPAHAESKSATYIGADGSDLTVVAKCISPQLSEGNLDRALEESGNDFLEKVFGTKGSYDQYERAQPELEFLDCLKRNGVTPQVEQN